MGITIEGVILLFQEEDVNHIEVVHRITVICDHYQAGSPRIELPHPAKTGYVIQVLTIHSFPLRDPGRLDGIDARRNQARHAITHNHDAVTLLEMLLPTGYGVAQLATLGLGREPGDYNEYFLFRHIKKNMSRRPL